MTEETNGKGWKDKCGNVRKTLAMKVMFQRWSGWESRKQGLMAKLGELNRRAEEDQGLNKSNFRFGKYVPYISKFKLLLYPEDGGRMLN